MSDVDDDRLLHCDVVAIRVAGGSVIEDGRLIGPFVWHQQQASLTWHSSPALCIAGGVVDRPLCQPL